MWPRERPPWIKQYLPSSGNRDSYWPLNLVQALLYEFDHFERGWQGLLTKNIPRKSLGLMEENENVILYTLAVYTNKEVLEIDIDTTFEAKFLFSLKKKNF